MIEKPGTAKTFQSGQIGKMTLKNRFVMPPMGTNFASEDGRVTRQLLDFYEARASGGAGLVIVEVTCVDTPVGKGLGRELAIDDDLFLPGLSELAEVVKRQGACAAIQLHHAGIDARPSITGVQAVGPSAICMPTPGHEKARDLTVSEIHTLVDSFTHAALRAKRAGFDAVEVHGAHPYLLAQFASAAWNKRGDDYGGELKNRARFLIEIIKSIKQTVGSDFPVWPRINAIEYYLENGIDIEQGKRLAEMIQDAGADAVHVSCFGWGTLALANLPETTGALLPLAREIKSVVNIPVIAVGRITPELAEQALDEGWADFFAIGRASFADPNYVAKVSQGRSEDIASCIACNHCLHTLLSYDNQVGCAVNAALGREREYRVTHTANPKKVLVVGGGPAGLETARIASLRGHQVILCEKTSELGGQLILASVPPTKSDRIEPLARYLIRQVEKSDVEIRLNTEVTVPLVEEVRPDVVVLACGIASNLPDIPGIESPNVVSFSDVLSEKCVVGDKVAVIGAEMVGCETAEFLADKGKQVTLMRRGRRVATKIMPFSRPALLQRLRSKHVTFLTGVTYREINDIGVALIMKEGEHKTVEADTVVIAAGATSNNALFKVLEGKVPELHLIGDALEPRGILEAIREGAQVGRADAKLL